MQFNYAVVCDFVSEFVAKKKERKGKEKKG
jgi:hypothetical protein